MESSSSDIHNHPTPASRTRTDLDGSKTSTKSSFFGKTVKVVCFFTTFVGGLVFFPVVSIANAVSAYRYNKNTDYRSIKASAIRAVQGFLIPIPIIGGIVICTGQIANRVKPGSCLANNKAISTAETVILAIPFLGSAYVAVCLAMAKPASPQITK